ncbi:hypothetical protein [Vampirovibrio sp.]|uniref:hypothetical protein n=1 Tax=Vampirovibrio sp. TaxID=2717857 RepID=UPI00359452F0
MVDVAPRYQFLCGLLILAGLSFVMENPAQSTELDGFAINTQDKSVTVTLFTDQRASYTTEHQGKQFTIVLPDTQLSQDQITNGLPVVIDNKNRFIGRAVPSDDGKVKIILPNLPASDYHISIQQKRPGAAAVKTAPPAEKLKPRPAVQAQPESQFEQVAANFPKPAPKKDISVKTSRLKLSPAPTRNRQAGEWNPYVYRPSDFQKTARLKPSVKAASQKRLPNDEPVNTISVADSLRLPAEKQTSLNETGPTQTDPLWYLHALPTNSATPTDTLQGPAVSGLPLAVTAPAQPSPPAPSEIKELTSEIREGFQALPQWLIITVAVFLGGMGLFCLIGGLVLLKVLLSQSQSSLGKDANTNGMPYLTGMVPLYAPPEPVVSATPAPSKKQAATSSRPSYGQASLRFEDKVSVQALDYLKGSSPSVSQAIYNTSLVKFPASRKQRSLGVTRQKAGQL